MLRVAHCSPHLISDGTLGLGEPEELGEDRVRRRRPWAALIMFLKRRVVGCALNRPRCAAVGVATQRRWRAATVMVNAAMSSASVLAPQAAGRRVRRHRAGEQGVPRRDAEAPAGPGAGTQQTRLPSGRRHPDQRRQDRRAGVTADGGGTPPLRIVGERAPPSLAAPARPCETPSISPRALAGAPNVEVRNVGSSDGPPSTRPPGQHQTATSPSERASQFRRRSPSRWTTSTRDVAAGVAVANRAQQHCRP
jgi:hypothetical protein